jgi:hypothetical protein
MLVISLQTLIVFRVFKLGKQAPYVSNRCLHVDFIYLKPVAGKEDNSNKGNKEPDYDQDEGQLEEKQEDIEQEKTNNGIF